MLLSVMSQGDRVWTAVPGQKKEIQKLKASRQVLFYNLDIVAISKY